MGLCRRASADCLHVDASAGTIDAADAGRFLEWPRQMGRRQRLCRLPWARAIPSIRAAASICPTCTPASALPESPISAARRSSFRLYDALAKAPTAAITSRSCRRPARLPAIPARVSIAATTSPRSSTRIAVADDGMMYLMYEWHAHPVLRTSADGINWSEPAEVQIPSGTWPTSYAPCDAVERIGPHRTYR